MATPVQWQPPTSTPAGDPLLAAPATQIIGLSNGYSLLAWQVGNVGTVGMQPGADIIGKILDPEGGIIRDSFQLNTAFVLDNELDFDIAATNDGGFILVYVDDFDPGSLPGSPTTAIRWERFDSLGNQVDFATIAPESTDPDELSRPKVTVNLLDNTSLVVYQDQVGGDTDINARFVSSTGVPGAEFAAAQNSADDDFGANVAILKNGTFVSVYSEEDPGATSIEAKLFTSTGAQIGGNINLTSGSPDSFASGVAALDNGNWVAVWVSDGDIKFSVRDPVGTPVTSILTAAGGPVFQSVADIVALRDGDFVISWAEFTSPLSNKLVKAQRFNADGTPDGAAFEVWFGALQSLDMSVTADGRILFSWHPNAFSDLFTSIWDPRGSTINASDYDTAERNFVSTTVVTTGIGDTLLTGDDSSELFLGQDGDDTIIGGDGDDTILGGGGDDVIEGGLVTDTIDAGPGNDVIRVRDGEFIDNVNGGPGTDVLDHSALPGSWLLGGVFDFHAGNASTAIQDPVFVTLASIEEYRDGDGGNTVFAPAGGFTFRGNGGNDIFHENAAAGADDVDLGAGDDRLNVNNAVIGDDTFDGGTGTDLADFSNVTFPSGTRIDLSAGEVRLGAATESFVNFENVFGSQGNDSITGDAFDNRLEGDLGDDTIKGGGGSDTLVGGGGNEVLEGGTGIDSIEGGAGRDLIRALAGDFFIDNVDGGSGYDILDHSQLSTTELTDGTFDFAAGTAQVPLQGGTARTLLGIEEYRDNAGSNTFIDSSANLTILAGAGDDTFVSGAGLDVFDGGPDNDTADYSGEPGGITYVGASGVVVTEAFNTFDLLISVESIIGSAFSDTFFGGPSAIDVRGGDGADILIGGASDDVLNGEDGDDFVFGGAGTDVIEGGEGTDFLSGNDNFGLLADGVTDRFVYSQLPTSPPDVDILDFDPGAPGPTGIGGDVLDYSALTAQLNAWSLIFTPDGQGNSIIGLQEAGTVYALAIVIGVADPLDIVNDNILT